MLLATTPSVAGRPNVDKLVSQMQAALEPARPSVRKMTFTISAETGEATRWIIGQARKPLKDGSCVLTVILAPAEQKGTTYLMRKVKIGALEGAAITGGLSALGAALYGIGIPKNSVLEYETALKSDKFLVIAHGTADDVTKAKSVLGQTRPAKIAAHQG